MDIDLKDLPEDSPKPAAPKAPAPASTPTAEKAPPRPYWSPYVAGFGLGLTLLAAYWLLGTGLGASAGVARTGAWLEHLVCPTHVEASGYFGRWFGGGSPLAYYLVFMVVGVFLGGLISAFASGRVKPGVERGPRVSAPTRLILALVGGVLVGYASRLARGCTSGQALSGTALLFSGSIVFLVCVFVGGYVAALFVRREWR